MVRGKRWKYDPDQDDQATMRKALKASERESSLYPYTNSLYLAEPIPPLNRSWPYLQWPTSADSAAPLTRNYNVDQTHQHQRNFSPSSVPQPYGPSGDSRIDLYTSLPTEQPPPRNGARNFTNTTDTLTQAERPRANNPFQPRHNITASNPPRPPKMPPPTPSQDPYADFHDSQPTDRTPLTVPASRLLEESLAKAERLFPGMSSGDEVTAEVERSRNRQVERGSRGDREQEVHPRRKLPAAPRQDAGHGAMHVQQQNSNLAVGSRQAMDSAEGTNHQAGMAPTAASPQSMGGDGGMNMQQRMATPVAPQSHSENRTQQNQQPVTVSPAAARAAPEARPTKQCTMCGQVLPLSLFAKGTGYQTRCKPCRDKHNTADRANALKRKQDEERDEASGRRVCRACGQRLELDGHFRGKAGSRGEKNYTKCFECRGEAKMRK